jgi:two-component system sensor histidine kinase HydH
MGGMPRRRGQGMQAGMAGGRLVFLAYDAASLRSGERNLYIGGFLVSASLALAFGFFLYSARSLDAYREREAHNRELVALGEAARTLAHEIKNPLGIVKIQCALLRKSLNNGEVSRNEIAQSGPLRELRIIEEETDRLARLASRIRDFLSAGSANPVLISVRSLFDSLGDRYGDRISVHFAERLQGETPGFVSVDPVRLDQMLDNVLANAFESMEGMESSTNGNQAVVDLSAEVRRNRLIVSVADRGSGISPGDAKRVFDLFFTTKSSGSGIGLALTKRYAEASGGSIRFEPRQGGGSVFILELPFQGDVRA